MRRFRFFAAGLSSVSSVLGRFAVISSSVCRAAKPYQQLCLASQLYNELTVHTQTLARTRSAQVASGMDHDQHQLMALVARKPGMESVSSIILADIMLSVPVTAVLSVHQLPQLMTSVFGSLWAANT